VPKLGDFMKKKTNAQPKIKYTSGDQLLLDTVKPLWEELNNHHCSCSEHFKSHYRAMTFEKRKTAILKKTINGGELRVDFAVDEVTGKGVGYIVSSINAEGTGEIESVYVDGVYRRIGVGGMLMRNALAWMTQKGVVEKIVEVSVGNEAAWGFYGKFGFMPRKTVLKQKE
jgi:ribosomal protein S18 acetylase RimI-like enzyme